jgi:hypothetical protein
MSQRCIKCKINPNIYWNLLYGEIEVGYKLFDFCQHCNISLFNNKLCIQCTINNIKHENKLQNIFAKELKSMTCIKWKTGQSKELYCWKNNVPNRLESIGHALKSKDFKVPMCDIANCNYPAVKKYIKLENFVNNVKNNFYLGIEPFLINIPMEIFNIIICYSYRIHPNKNGLCINHNNDYNISIEKLFTKIPKCEICCDKMKYNPIIQELLQDNNYFNGNSTLYHIPSDRCNIVMAIDTKYYSFGGCLELCKQLNTWCEICKECIGHTNVINDIYTHNIIKYPHCEICGKHSAYPHCNKCNIHLPFSHCELCSTSYAHYKNPHCKICNIHSQYQHCKICGIHDDNPHCELCGTHSKYTHCENSSNNSNRLL